MATRNGDVAGTVHEVVAAFDKAVNLVRRVEDRKDAKDDPEAIRDLFRSLSLGPVIVQGYFDADAKRFGQSYLIGDYQAQVELRDILLGLKNLVGELQDVLLDDSHVDFRQLQETSDACRSNAGVCLGQLSQRLAQARDPMAMHMQNPPPQYVSGVPPISSPSLHYSSSRSTHSSNGGRMPNTPDPYFQQQALSPQWQSKRSEAEEQRPQLHSRQSTDASLQETYANWSQSSQLFTERDIDELSMRRPSSHTLAPEDGALLSPGLLSGERQRSQVLPGQLDLVRDSYTSLDISHDSQSPARQSNTSSAISRDRYGPDDFSPTVEQHGPFRLDRDSAQSLTSYASRAHDGPFSTLEHVSSDYGPAAEPQPLRLPHRPSQQPTRQFSNGPQAPPPRRPVPSVPRQTTEAAGLMPTHMYGQKVPIPPRSHSRPVPDTLDPQQRLLTSQPIAPPFQPSPQVQRAIQSDQARRKFNVDQSQQYPSQLSLATQPMPTSPVSSQNSSNTNSMVSPQPTYTSAKHPLPQSSTGVLSSQPSQSASQLTRAPSTSAIPIPQNLPLNLPTDKNTAPFCKGAFRLFIGLQKKAFVSANRPIGMSSFIAYWRCDKCLFEGPMHTAPGPPDKKGRPGKPEKIFDPTIRECGPLSTAVVGPDGRGEGSGGIRYKWAFLAKCHVPLKTLPEGKLDGSFGGYGCIFCTAEGQARGWTAANIGLNGPGGLNDAASTFSGKSGNSASSASSATPVFGNIKLFMDHLQMHRLEENWPCPEMRGRMKCIVGRIADRNEDWEVNFLPH